MNKADNKKKQHKLKARLPKGFEDTQAHHAEIAQESLEKIACIYQKYGFKYIDTPIIEYADAIGKFLPDQERPNEGIFAIQDEDQQWLALRYDLTAPLARYVAQNYDTLPKPFRAYRMGYVFRNEKPGLGRLRQFMQADADTVGAEPPFADAEACMIMADIMHNLNFKPEHYTIRVNNRKILDAILQTAHIEQKSDRKKHVMRAIDKLDRLGPDAVKQLLTKGRKDESGDFTKGAELTTKQTDIILNFVQAGAKTNKQTLSNLSQIVKNNDTGAQGIEELKNITEFCQTLGYQHNRITIDPSVVRGLDYYTGPVFELECHTLNPKNPNDGQRIGSLGGGGRYDTLIRRFKNETIPATGTSIGITRLIIAQQKIIPQNTQTNHTEPVIILVMEKDQITYYHSLAQKIRNAGINAEVYMGNASIKAQMKYADKRNSPCVIIRGEDERKNNQIQIKDLKKGTQIAQNIHDNKQWRQKRAAQITADENQIIKILTDIRKKSDQEK